MAQHIFTFNEKLPFKSEIVMMIRELAPGGKPTGSGETQLRKDAISSIVLSLINLWTKAFGAEYIQTRKTVRKNIVKLMQDYHNSVIYPKYKSEKTERELIREWRSRNHVMFPILRADVDPSKFAEEECIFFKNQQLPSRPGYITDKVDENYVQPASAIEDTDNDTADEGTQADSDEDFVADDDELLLTTSSHSLSLEVLSTTRSGTVRCLD